MTTCQFPRARSDALLPPPVDGKGASPRRNVSWPRSRIGAARVETSPRLPVRGLLASQVTAPDSRRCRQSSPPVRVRRFGKPGPDVYRLGIVIAALVARTMARAVVDRTGTRGSPCPFPRRRLRRRCGDGLPRICGSRRERRVMSGRWETYPARAVQVDRQQMHAVEPVLVR